MIKIAVWGTGLVARLLCNRELSERIVDFFIDSKSEKRDYKGKIVQHPSNVDYENTFIIVATTDYYEEITRELKSKGLSENFDYTKASSAAAIEEFLFGIKLKYCNIDSHLCKEKIGNYLLGFKQAFSELINDDEVEENVKHMLVSSDVYIGTKVYESIEVRRKLNKWFRLDKEMFVKSADKLFEYLFFKRNRSVEAILKLIADEENRLITFRDGTVFEYINMHDFAVTVEEILLDEDYYFESSSPKPTIIDAGANVGLATYYFVKNYPNANVIAFEPMPDLYDIVRRNIARNGWSNVKVYQYALDGSDGKHTFYVAESSIAGSLLAGRQNSCVNEIVVEVSTLGKFIDGPIEYLKMDIEGSETRVFEEIGNRLAFVNHIFFEYHESDDFSDNSLAKILSLLDKYKFSYNIDKSKFYAKTKKRPMQNVGKKISEVVWAKRKHDWE